MLMDALTGALAGCVATTETSEFEDAKEFVGMVFTDDDWPTVGAGYVKDALFMLIPC